MNHINRTLVLIMFLAFQISLSAADITFNNPDAWTITVTVHKNPTVTQTINPGFKKTIYNIGNETVEIVATGKDHTGKEITISKKFTGYNNGKRIWTIHPHAYEKDIMVNRS